MELFYSAIIIAHVKYPCFVHVSRVLALPICLLCLAELQFRNTLSTFHPSPQTSSVFLQQS